MKLPRSRFLSLFLVALVLAACGDSRLTTSATGSEQPRERPAYDPNRDGPAIPPDDDTTRGPRCCVLVPAIGETSVGVAFEGSVDLGVYLFSLTTGDPLPDNTIEWRIEGDGTAGSRLSAANSFTDIAGLAQIRFDAGSVATAFRVIASFPGANEVAYDVTVLDMPVGAVEVTVVHPSSSIYPVSPINVRLFKREDLRCSFLSPGEYPADFFVQTDLESTREQALFENLLADETFTIVATGFGAMGEVAAQACLEEVYVEEGVTREVELVLQLLPLNPIGEYDVQSWWDFTDALLETGAVGAIIVDILDLFEDPGEQILDYMVDAIGYFVGGWVSDVIEVFLSVTRLDRLIGDAINDLINSSDALRQFFSIGCDLRRMVTRLQILSILSIGKIGSDFEIFGVDTWTGLGICDFTPDDDFMVGECDERPDCDRIQIQITDGSLGLLRGDWTGRVLSYNQLTIDRHAVDFNYGRLILFILDNFLFPAITGEPAPVSLEDVFSSIVNCEGFGEMITGSDGEICVIGCITAEDLEGFCDGAISLVFGTLFEGFVGSLSFDSVLEMRGSCTLVNEDTDLEVESLSEGEYTGTINIGSSSSPFNSTFVGQRR